MPHFILLEVEVEFEFFEVVIEQFGDLTNVLFLHGSQIRVFGLVWKSVKLDLSGNSLILAESWESDFDEFLWVETPMIIAGLNDWGGNYNSGSINCLPHVPNIDSPGDFFYKDGRKSVLSEFLVDAEEVDFSHFGFVFFVLHDEHYRNAGNEAN